MNIIDVGAGDGKRCANWLKKFKSVLVYAFEPDPRQYKLLERTKNQLKDEEKRRFKIYNMAVWNENCEKDFYMCNDNSSSSLLPFVDENIKRWKYPAGRYYFKTLDTIKVKCVTLDKIIKDENIRIIDFLRIDCQGTAFEVLKSISKKKLRHIKEILLKVNVCDFEIYKGQSNREEIKEYLKPCHFYEVKIDLYSRNQEAWIRYHSDVWKRVRNSKIYNLD